MSRVRIRGRTRWDLFLLLNTPRDSHFLEDIPESEEIEGYSSFILAVFSLHAMIAFQSS